MQYCSKCQAYKNVTNSANYCPTCGTAFGTLAKTSSGEVVNIINKSAKPLVEYADKNGGKVKVSAQVDNAKLSTLYTPTTSYTTKFSYTPETSYTPRISYPTTSYTTFGTVAKSSSSISMGEFANTIKESSETLIEHADKFGGNSKVKVSTQVGNVKISTSYTPTNYWY